MDSDKRVLLAAATAKDAEVTCSLLSGAGLKCITCESLQKVMQEIDGGVGAILMTEDAFGAKGLPELLEKLEGQPSWSDIPIVILMHGDRRLASAADVLSRLTNVTLLERPAPVRSVISAVQAAVRGRVRQYQLREQFQAIREVRERLEAMANFIPQLAWMAQPDGFIFWYNRRWFEYTGTTQAEMEGWGWQKVHDPAELPRVLEKWRASLQTGTPFDMTFPLKGADGQFRPFLTRVMPFEDEQGKIVLWFGTNTEVTEQLRMMEERNQLLTSEQLARADAEKAGRLKDEFLATLSHELRTPLNAILGWAQILRRHHRDDSELHEGLSIIERNARSQAQLVEDLLDMSRIVSGKLRMDMQVVNVAEVTNAAIESVRPAAEVKEIQLEKVFDAPVSLVRGDPARLQQIIWNLLSNAIKFTPKGGRVSVSCAILASSVEITVTDTGLGINPDFLPYVFERFRQADPSTTRKYGGLGLGLAIVKNLVDLHGGTVRAESKGEGKGASFIVELPVIAVHSTAGGDLRGAAELLGKGALHELYDPELLSGITVLVVDDDEDARKLISRVLEECNAKVVTAPSARDALELLQRERPAVLVSDIGMPQEDGYELIRKVRLLPDAQGGKTPAAALTAFARSEDRTRALRAGYHTHLSKPVEPSELVAVVASLAGISRQNGKRP